MEEHDKSNPIASTEAIVNPKPLTISQIALLSRVNSAVLFGNATDIGECLKALYLVSLPVKEAAAHIKTADEDSLVWADENIKGQEDYSERICSLLDSVLAFWKMLPAGDPKKKASDTATDGSQNS